MDYPFINFKNLSDDELMNRIARCNQVLATESAFGHNSIVQSARAQLEAYEFEWNERMQSRARKEYFEKNPRHSEPIEIGVVGQDYELEEKDVDKVDIVEEVILPKKNKEKE